VLAVGDQQPVCVSQGGDERGKIWQRSDRFALREMPQRPDHAACAEVQVAKALDGRFWVVARMRSPAQAWFVCRQCGIGNAGDRITCGGFVPQSGLQRLMSCRIKQAGHHGRTLLARGSPRRRV